jgi:hypothetical protein
MEYYTRRQNLIIFSSVISVPTNVSRLKNVLEDKIQFYRLV